MAMKTMLSMPSTISSSVSVTRLIQASGDVASLIHGSGDVNHSMRRSFQVNERGVKHQCFKLRFLFLTIALGTVLALKPSHAAPAEPNHVISLFNGTNFAGWRSWLVDSHFEDSRGVFSVTNGEIHISGDGLGYLGTTNTFRDYVLALEFRWGVRNTHWGDRIGKARDSGVFLHATGPDGNSADGRGAFMAAIECNIFQGATGDFLLIRGTNSAGEWIAPRVSFLGSGKMDRDGFRWFDPSGAQHKLERWGRVNWRNKASDWRDELDFRKTTDVERPGWNELEIKCAGARISVRLNGTLVNEAFGVAPTAGRILLQCEGSEIFFRRIELRPLP
jgi:hypothetical protein